MGPALRVDAKSQRRAEPFEHKLIVRETGFRFPPTDPQRYSGRLPRLRKIKERKPRIIDDIIAASQEGRRPSC